MSKKKHVHKYGRVVPRKENPSWVIFKCFLPGCSHYLHGEILVLGKESLCWLCSQPFIMTEKHRTRKPECNRCKGIETVVENVPSVEDILNDVMKSVKE